MADTNTYQENTELLPFTSNEIQRFLRAYFHKWGGQFRNAPFGACMSFEDLYQEAWILYNKVCGTHIESKEHLYQRLVTYVKNKYRSRHRVQIIREENMGRRPDNGMCLHEGELYQNRAVEDVTAQLLDIAGSEVLFTKASKLSFQPRNRI